MTCRSSWSPAGLPGSSARTDRGEDDDTADAARSGPPDRGTATIGGVRYPDLVRRSARRRGARGRRAHKDRTGRDHLRIVCAAAATRASARTRCLGWSAYRRRQPDVPRLFARHAPASRCRGGAARGPAGADPRRTGQRAGSRGHRWMRELLRAFAAQGRTVFVSSHLLGEMAQLADDVVIVAAGRYRAGPGGSRPSSSYGRSWRLPPCRAPALRRAERVSSPPIQRPRAGEGMIWINRLVRRCLLVGSPPAKRGLGPATPPSGCVARRPPL